MSVRTLFNIILKVIGILFLKELITSTPQFLSTIYLLLSDDKLSSSNYVWILCVLIFNVSFFIFPFVFLIFKTEYVIDLLKLGDGLFEDNITFNMHRSTVLSITVMVVGGILFVEEIPALFYKVYQFFFYKKTGLSNENIPTLIYLSIIKVIVGLFLMIGQRQIVNLIERQRKNK